MPRFRLPSRIRRVLLSVVFLVGTAAARTAGAPSLPLLLVWPPDGVTVNGERVRVGGRTDPNATVTVNGASLPVFPSGAFAGTCPLAPGTNRLLFRAATNSMVTTGVRTVRRPPPLRTLPATPVRFDPAFEGEPSEDLEVRPGDTIRIRVKGSPGRKATFRIGSGQTHYPLFPTSREDVEGFYEGAYQVGATDRFVQARVTCYLWSGTQRSRAAARLLVPARITVNANPFPDVARATEDYVRLRTEPVHGGLVALAPRGSYLQVVGCAGDRLRVALTPSLHGWLGRGRVRIANDEPPCQRGVVRDLTVDESDEATTVRIPLGLRVPYAITHHPEGPALELTLFGVENRINWITDRTPRGLVETMASAPPGDDSCRLLVSLRGSELLGYHVDYQDTELRLLVRHRLPPPQDPSRPLAGRTVILDPGHGGASKGTIGSTGVAEKTVNLELCALLRGQMEKQGAHVRLTRSGDSEVSLADRARFAEQGGDLFVSLHNNAIGLTADPLAARGVGVFYYHPHAHDVAHAIYRRMLAAEPRPEPYGVVTADFFVCREITAMPSVLLECLFLSHPADEMLLLDKAFAQRYMEAVAAGIGDWFDRAAGKSARAGDTGGS